MKASELIGFISTICIENNVKPHNFEVNIIHNGELENLNYDMLGTYGDKDPATGVGPLGIKGVAITINTKVVMENNESE